MIDYATFCQLRSLLDEKRMNQAQVASESRVTAAATASSRSLSNRCARFANRPS